MPEIKFHSEFLKAKDNVNQGDHIRFLDAGLQDEDGRWSFTVAVIDKLTQQITAQKKFTLNKVNFNAIAKVYGTNSDKWLNKEMRVFIITTQNQKGELVPAIRLQAPGAVEQGLEEDQGEVGEEVPEGLPF